MRRQKSHHKLISKIGNIMAGILIVIIVAGSVLAWRSFSSANLEFKGLGLANQTVQDLDRLGLLQKTDHATIAKLLDYQTQTGKSLAEIIVDPFWGKQLGLTTTDFKVTWYMANPFELLPNDLQKAIRQQEIPFRSRTHVWQWCRQNNVSEKWRHALYLALIETTPHNLWRAAKGERPFAKNGQYLEPIVVDHGDGHYEVRDGHIATDPLVIPTNSEVILVVRVDGVDRVLKVKAADIGGAIKGKHIDIPMQLGPESASLPHTRFPKAVRNPSVTILFPPDFSNPNQKV